MAAHSHAPLRAGSETFRSVSVFIPPIETPSVQYGHGTLAYEGKACPVDRERLVAELLEKIKFRLLERGAFVGAGGKILVEALHESDGEDIVGSPEAGNDGFCAGEQEGTFKTGDTFSAQEFSGSGFAG